MELILKQMEDALRGLQVVPVETVGAMFDPRVHEALGSIETAEFPDHQVVEEIRKGYKIREKAAAAGDGEDCDERGAGERVRHSCC